MPPKTRVTGFTRILLVLLLMAAVFFGVQAFLSQTELGQQTHQELLEATDVEGGAED